VTYGEAVRAKRLILDLIDGKAKLFLIKGQAKSYGEGYELALKQDHGRLYREYLKVAAIIARRPLG
jgi:hypothetical protein